MKVLLGLPVLLLAISLTGGTLLETQGAGVSSQETASVFGTCVMSDPEVSPRCYGGCMTGGCGCRETTGTQDGDKHPHDAKPCVTNEGCTDVLSATQIACSGY